MKRAKSSAAQILCDQAGVSMREVCRKAQLSERTFRRYAAQGAPFVAAERLCWALGDKVNPMVFVYGYRRWRELEKQIGESRDAPPPAGNSRRKRPVSILTMMPGGERR